MGDNDCFTIKININEVQLKSIVKENIDIKMNGVSFKDGKIYANYKVDMSRVNKRLEEYKECAKKISGFAMNIENFNCLGHSDKEYVIPEKYKKTFTEDDLEEMKRNPPLILDDNSVYEKTTDYHSRFLRLKNGRKVLSLWNGKFITDGTLSDKEYTELEELRDKMEEV